MNGHGENPPVLVVFRQDPDGTVFALFPEEKGDVSGYWCLAYQHVGQHSAADYAGCIRRSRPAKGRAIAPLRRELEGIGYRLTIRQRWIRGRR